MVRSTNLLRKKRHSPVNQLAPRTVGCSIGHTLNGGVSWSEFSTESPPGSIAPHDCKCLAGFENTAYEVASNFFKVPAGDFAQVRDRCQQGGSTFFKKTTTLRSIPY